MTCSVVVWRSLIVAATVWLACAHASAEPTVPTRAPARVWVIVDPGPVPPHSLADEARTAIEQLLRARPDLQVLSPGSVVPPGGRAYRLVLEVTPPVTHGSEVDAVVRIQLVDAHSTVVQCTAFGSVRAAGTGSSVEREAVRAAARVVWARLTAQLTP